jgi:hypothetical protein
VANGGAHVVQIGIEYPLRHLHVNPRVREVRYDHEDVVNRTNELWSVVLIHERSSFVFAVTEDDSRLIVGVDVSHELRHFVVAVDELGYNSNSKTKRGPTCDCCVVAVPQLRCPCHTLHTGSASPTRVWPRGMRPRTAALPAKEVQPVIAFPVWEPSVTITPRHLVELVVETMCLACHAPYAQR